MGPLSLWLVIGNTRYLIFSKEVHHYYLGAMCFKLTEREDMWTIKNARQKRGGTHLYYFGNRRCAAPEIIETNEGVFAVVAWL